MNLLEIICRVLVCDAETALYHIKEGDVYVNMIQRTDPDLKYTKPLSLRIRNKRHWITPTIEHEESYE